MDEFQLNPPLPLPAGQTEADITALFGSVEVEGAPKQELENYWQARLEKVCLHLWHRLRSQRNVSRIGCEPLLYDNSLEIFYRPQGYLCKLFWASVCLEISPERERD